MKSEFATFHPIINFTYFTIIFIFSMIFMHPICLIISFISGFTYSVLLKGKKAVKFNLVYLLPAMLMAALINPAFNHEGTTILTYLSNGNPLTLESIVYGFAAAVMLACIICWFSCYNVIMTSDKFIYIFGRIIPSLSLIISMSLRFIPRFKAQIKVIASAQRCIGRDVSSGSIIKRAKCGLKILSIMVTWALENAIETADSMKARGYGLHGRTSFSIYRFDKRDMKALAILLCTTIYVLIGAINGGLYFRYFPNMKGVKPNFYAISVLLSYAILCITPILIEILEEIKWKQLKSKI